MTRAEQVFNQNDGDVTRAYYAELGKCGKLGHVAVCLFRAQKRSARAKDYRPGKYRRAAYDVKQWSIDEVCKALTTDASELGIKWGWKEDPKTLFGEDPAWVIYLELPGFGQCSFHSPTRGKGPAFEGDWDGQHKSQERILAFAEHVMAGVTHGM